VISHSSEHTIRAFTALATDSNLSVVVPPMHYQIRAMYAGRSVEIDMFTSYVERAIRLPEGIDPTEITTGVVMDQDGSIRHVPTKISVIDGAYYAVIHSLTNSAYSLVRHSVEFMDMERHWAAATVHN